MRTRIQFKNSHAIRFEATAADTLYGPAPMNLSLETVQNWRAEGLSAAALVVQSGASGVEQNAARLKRLCESAGLRLEIVHLADLHADGFASIQNLARRLQADIRDGSLLFSYEDATRGAAINLGAMFLVTLRALRELDPAAAVKYITGQAGDLAHNRIVYEFKHFLDPRFPAPPDASEEPLPIEEIPAPAVRAARPADEPEAADRIRSLRPTLASEPEPAFAGDALGAVLENRRPLVSGETQGASRREPQAPAKANGAGGNGAGANGHSTGGGAQEAPAPATRPEEPPFSRPAAPRAETVSVAAPQAGPVSAPVAADKTTPAAAAPTAPVSAPPASLPPAPAVRPPLSVASGAPTSASGSFKKSRFTIGAKMLSIITSLLVTALSVMIFLASYFFLEEMRGRIEENSLDRARILGQRVESELESISYKAHLMALSLDQNIGTGEQQALVAQLFFRDNKDFVFLAVADRTANGFSFRRALSNAEYLATNNIAQSDMEALAQSQSAALAEAFNGATVVNNASQGTTPMLGVSLPLGANSIVILFLEPSQVLKSFQSEGAMRTFMVNGKGDVIAHPDSNVVLARASFLKSPIVESLLKSTNENGQLRFIDPDDGKAYIGAFQKLALSGLGMVSVIDEDTAFAAVYHIQNRNLWIMAIVLVISFLVVYFFSKTISVPIIDLVGATRQIEEGDYGISIEPMSGDEVGSLTHSFRQMAVGLGEREKLKDGMLRFVNKKVMEMTIAGTLKLGGESKDAAIFFSDLRGFTAMSETMTPEDVVAFLNEYFTGMVACVNQTHGEVDKFIGDAVMAHWGALESHGNDCENAINAAILMRKAIIAFNERGAGNRPIAKMGCGINFGPVVAGMLGSEEKLSYTVIGDAVNLASRIESLNKPLGTDILISQDAYERVPGIFKVEQMPSITVKGKSEPQVLYAVVGRLDDPDCPKDLDEVRRILGIEHDSHKEVDLDAKEEKFKVVGSAKGAH